MADADEVRAEFYVTEKANIFLTRTAKKQKQQQIIVVGTIAMHVNTVGVNNNSEGYISEKEGWGECA